MTRTRWVDTVDPATLTARLADAADRAHDHYGAGIEEVASWYILTRDRLDHDHPDTDTRTRCGVFAALSPGCHVERNHQLASEMLATGDCNHPYGNATRKARAIAEGGDPDLVLGGQKVRSFYANLLDPLDPMPVTIDRHQSVILGWPNRELERAGAYDLAADIHRWLAAKYGLRPNELQALTWSYHRDTKQERTKQ